MSRPDKRNNWNTSYSSIAFLEGALRGHSAVAAFVRERDIVFRVTRHGGLAVVAVLVNQYTIGQADVIRVQDEFPDATCIVAIGDWCGYTREAKQYGLDQGVGVFILSEFMGALNRADVATYVRKDSKGRETYAYRSA